jgi:UDPglucose 6-dehydrogenase
VSGTIAVVGLWHLGCSISVSWLKLDRQVVMIDLGSTVADGLRQGRAPVYEPGMDEALAEGLSRGALRVAESAEAVTGCAFVFIAYDTPVDDQDDSDLTPIREAVEEIGPHLPADAIVIVSAQLPVGEARALRARLRTLAPTAELVYSPENLRLGEAIGCYLSPGHIVIGAESPAAGDRVEALFGPMKAAVFRMNLPSAEMTKHCINSFLATSVTMANQWSDIAAAMGADFGDVVGALRADPRIGPRAYITPGIGFSGGTLGRDLRVLDGVNQQRLNGSAPLFGQIWSYNQRRADVVARRADQLLGGLRGKRLGLLGMTYKPGTSTLRRSLPLAVAQDLLARGASVTAHDPRADWREVAPPAGLVLADSPYAAAEGADLVVLLTEWPEYRELDFGRLAKVMRQGQLFDTKDFLRSQRAALAAAGLRRLVLGAPDA